ncbi:SH3 domain-containing protein [Rhizoctonia solani]|nr:SH3 domain-containing protein [Rhizoctonia solani]
MNQPNSSPTHFWVRAMHNYTPTSASELALTQGNMIEVITTSPNGWWDGVIEDRRGWFPGNYVARIEEGEVVLPRGGNDRLDSE